jgi:hypothetical protein
MVVTMEGASHNMIPMDWRRGRNVSSKKLGKMESLPKLDTSTSNTQQSARNSYASSTELNSARNSYASISDISTTSSRTSISSLPDSLNRVSSFSRTSYEFSPDSIQSSPISSREHSPSPQTRWAVAESVMRYVPRCGVTVRELTLTGPIAHLLQ